MPQTTDSAAAPLEAGVGPNLRYDAPASLVVFLVALPLCLGIALASDAPLISGVVAGIVGGLVVGPLSGSALSVSGPAAGLTVLVAGGIASLGSFEAFLCAVVLSGVLQIGAGLARIGVLTNLFPAAVIKGMLAGIGIILVLKQIPHALGRDRDYEGDLDFWLMGHQAHTFSEIDAALRTVSPGVALIAAVCLVLLILWELPALKSQPWAKLVPGPLVAVVVGTAMNEIFAAAAPALHIQPGQGHLVELPVLRNPLDLLASLPSPDWSQFGRPDVWVVAATIAAVGSLETLLSVEATDKLDPFKRTSSANRELLAQGVGNAVSGLLGGLPLTAVIVRSSANVYSGARTRTSAVLHGALLLVLVASVPALLNRVPLAALAAVLLTVGYKLARVDLFRSMYAKGWSQFAPFLVTVVATVFSDLLTGVALGFVVGVFFVILTNHHTAIAVVEEDGAYLVKLAKDVSFLNKTRLRQVLAEIPPGSEVVIDGHNAEYIDHDIYEQVLDFAQSAPHRGITVQLRSMESLNRPRVRMGV